MDRFLLKVTGQTVEFVDSPGEGYLRRATGPKAKRMSDLNLHMADLDFAEGCLRRLEALGDGDQLLAEALWYSAVLHIYKCFGNSGARGKLSEQKIFAAEPAGLKWFTDFKHLRNKHFAHDENAYSQALPMIAISVSDGQHQIDEVHQLLVITPTIDSSTTRALAMIVHRSKAEIDRQLTSLRADVIAELQEMDIDELLSLPKVSFTMADLEQVAQPRQS